jgi:RsiW-degrading membrane proteinase PrsW (M82 family)
MNERDTLLALGYVILPAGYLGLCVWMNRMIPKPPYIPYFFIFGSLGGYLLISAYLAPSPAALVVGLPFMACAFVSLIWAFVAALCAKPRSYFHTVAACFSGMVVVPTVLMIVFCLVRQALSP